MPEIASVQQIEKDALMPAEMDMTLLKKTEELTLYMIEQSKEKRIHLKIYTNDFPKSKIK